MRAIQPKNIITALFNGNLSNMFLSNFGAPARI